MTYENLDAEIINSLLGNGRVSLRDLADEIDVSVTTISNHLNDLEDRDVVKEYTPVVDYEKLGYDVTAIIQLKAEGGSLPALVDRVQDHKQMISVYEVTGDYDVIAIAKFKDTDDMNRLIKKLLSDADIKESSTNVVLNAASENKQFELDVN